MRRLVPAFAWLALAAGPALAAPKPGVDVVAATRRPPRALPAVARRVLEDGAVVASLSLPGSAELVVARASALGALDPEAARVGAFAAFPAHEEAAARGVTRECLVRDGVVVVLDRAPASELAFSLFSLGVARSAPPPSATALAIARLAAARGGSATGAAPSDDAVREAASALRAQGAAWIIVGDTDVSRAARLVERYVPASTAPVRASSTPEPLPPRAKLDARPGTLTWRARASSVGADAALELAWFALARRLGTTTELTAGPRSASRSISLAVRSARDAEASFSTARAALLRDGVTPEDVAAFRATREAGALSRDPREWALTLALVELHEGDARRAARELALVWEANRQSAASALATEAWSASFTARTSR